MGKIFKAYLTVDGELSLDSSQGQHIRLTEHSALEAALDHNQLIERELVRLRRQKDQAVIYIKRLIPMAKHEAACFEQVEKPHCLCGLTRTVAESSHMINIIVPINS